MARMAVTNVSIPAMSTIGYATGTDVETGKPVRIAGDHRPLHDLGEALAVAEEPIEVEYEDWQIV